MNPVYQQILQQVGNQWYAHDKDLVQTFDDDKSLEINSHLMNRIGDNYRVFVDQLQTNVYQINDDCDSFAEFDMAPGSDKPKALAYVKTQPVTLLNDECLAIDYQVAPNESAKITAQQIVKRMDQLLQIQIELDTILRNSCPY